MKEYVKKLGIDFVRVGKDYLHKKIKLFMEIVFLLK